MDKPSEIHFADEKVQKTFEELTEEPLRKQLQRAFEDIKENPFCGIQIPKRLIPREYSQKYNIKNLWKCNLPGAWRLIYSIEGGEAVIITIILEWMDHKTYDKKFKY